MKQTKLYRGYPNEYAALQRIASFWTEKNDFWPVEMVSQSVARAHVSLRYYEEKPDVWSGLILYQLIDDQAELIYLFVDPSKRLKGIGGILFREMVRTMCSELNHVELLLEVRPSNAGAVKFYESYGMKQTGRRSNYYSDGEDALIFRTVFNGKL